MDLITTLRAMGAGSRLLENEPMSRHTSFKIGGPADVLFFPESANELALARQAALDAGVNCTILGNGSNVLVKDGGIRGLTIIIGEPMSRISVEGTVIRAQAGALLTRVSREAQKAGLSGMTPLSGIPGSVGGAVAMNAGAYGGEIKDVLTGALVMDKNGDCVRKSGEELHLSYRNSDVLREGLIVLEAEFSLQRGDSEVILNEMNELARKRREKQPLHLPSAGSTFKRPEGYFAGALIQEAGLKGYAVGGAQVSELHAGFVVNTGSATAQDVLTLIGDVQKRVFDMSGVTLEPEVRILGE